MAETIPGYHAWEVAGKAVSVHISLEMIDRLSSVVMTGFGAIPRRGAEVGGILIGTISGAKVRIEEFEAVPCSYKLGPSYLLSESDSAAFAEAWQKWRPDSGRSTYAVGFYRSNTREQTTITDGDRELCATYFPPPSNVMLFIKPAAMKVSTAGFITYAGGRLEDESAQEFPFRSYELEGGTPPRRALGERPPRPERPARSRSQDSAATPARAHGSSGAMAEYASAAPAYSLGQTAPAGYSLPYEAEPERPYAVTTESNMARKRGWMWIPLSFIFLLLGVLLGFQAAFTIYPKNTATVSPTEDPYWIGLSVERTGDNLHVKWNRQAPALKLAQRGMLFIRDGAYTKQVELDAAQLLNGSVIYRKLSSKVQFRVELYPKEHVVVSEVVDFSE